MNSNNAATPVVALQLYTVRDAAAADMAGTLRRVAEIGYQGVELAGYGNSSAPEIEPLLRELNLKVVGSHTGFDALHERFDQVVQENGDFGNQFIVCPSMPNAAAAARADWIAFAGELNALGARLRDEAGMQLCYHNHDFEFTAVFDGVCGLDLLYQHSDPQLVQAEIDTYWRPKGGTVPAQYIRKYAGRAPLIHLKDMANNAAQSFAEIGTGILDWPAIFAASEAGGAMAYIVEQDTCPGDPFDSIRLSLENLKKMGKL